MFKQLALAALSASLVACGGTKEAEGAGKYADAVSETHDVSDMLARSENGRVVLDLRNTAVGFNIAKGVDYSAVDVICPSGRQMNLSRWVPELAAELKVAPSELQDGLFLYAPRRNVSASSVRYDCAPEPTCYTHIEENGWTSCVCEGLP